MGPKPSPFLRAGVIAAMLIALFAATAYLRPLGFMSPTGVSIQNRAPLVCPSANDDAIDSYDRGVALEDSGRIEDAKAQYLKAIALDPGYCDAMDNLGVVLRRHGQTEEAISWYKKSLAVKPDDAVAEQNLGLALFMAGRTDESIAAYQELVRFAPDNPEGYFGLGSVYVQTNRPAAAIPMFVKADELYTKMSSPLVADARAGLGESYFGLQDCANALPHLEAAYPSFQDDRKVNLHLGICYASPAINKPTLAKKYLSHAKSLGAQIPDNLVRDFGL